MFFICTLDTLESKSDVKDEVTGMEEEETGEQDKKEGVNEEIKRDEGENESREKTLMELLVICAPILSLFTVLYATFYYLSLDIPILLISIFPAASRNIFCKVLGHYI